METKVKIEDREITIKEIKYKDLAGLGDTPKEEAAKKMMILSTDMTEEEYDSLSMKDGIILQKAINELNGLEDFQKPLVK